METITRPVADGVSPGRSRARLSFGIQTAPQHTTYRDLLAVWREADAIPLVEHAWLFDHFQSLGPDPDGPIFEAWTMLSALAAQTNRVRLGVLVTGNTYRHPAVLANMAATVDHLSEGRLIFGLGGAGHEGEHIEYGIPFPSPGERVERWEEACRLIRLLWTERQANFSGRYYRLTEARCEPKPLQRPTPPFMIPGHGRRGMGIVARHADMAIFGWATPEEFRERNALLNERCAEIGRDPAEIARGILFLCAYDDLAGTRENLRRLVEAGADTLILNLRAPFPAGIVERLAMEVFAPLGEELAG